MRTIFDEPISTVEEALATAKYDYVVEERELVIRGMKKLSKFKKSLVRTDTGEEIGAVGVKYHPIQNIDAFLFANKICADHGARFKMAYDVNGGAKVILYAEFPTPIKIKKNDEILGGISFINGFDGNTGLMANISAERVICTNGLRAPIEGCANKIAMRHTANVNDRLKQAEALANLTSEYFIKLKDASVHLSNTELTEKQVAKFLDSIIGKEGKSSVSDSKRTDITHLFQAGKGNHGKTAWDLYNGYVEYIDHSWAGTESRKVEAAIGRESVMKERAFTYLMGV